MSLSGASISTWAYYYSWANMVIWPAGTLIALIIPEILLVLALLFKRIHQVERRKDKEVILSGDSASEVTCNLPISLRVRISSSFSIKTLCQCQASALPMSSCLRSPLEPTVYKPFPALRVTGSCLL